MVKTPNKPATAFAFGSNSPHTSPFASSNNDLSSLEPTALVIFKGLQKRDSTTKAKASDELLSYLNTSDFKDNASAHEALIKIWSSMYSNLATDVDRKVRSNSHTIMGWLVVNLQKKTVRYLGNVCAAWFIGRHDNDRSVSKCAIEAFQNAFASESKREEFTNLFRAKIRARSSELAFHETAATLSDSRFTNEEDAAAKYSNIASAALLVLVELCNSDDQASEWSASIIADSTFWKVMQSSDPVIQKAALALLRSILRQSPALLQSMRLQIAKGVAAVLGHIQPNCALDAVETLAVLGASEPELIFTTKIEIKKPIPRRIATLIEKTATSGLSSQYWKAAADLLILATNCSDHSDAILEPLLSSFCENASKAIKAHALKATSSAVIVCVQYILAGSSAARDRLKLLVESSGESDAPYQAYTSGFLLLHPHDKSLAECFSVISKQIQATLRDATTSGNHQSDEYIELCMQLVPERIDLLPSLIETVHMAMQLSREGSSKAYCFVCKAIAQISLLQKDASFTAQREEFMLTLPSQSFSHPKATLSLLNSSTREEKERYSVQVLKADSSHNQNALSLVSHLLKDGGNLTAISTWIETDVHLCTDLEAPRWELYALYMQGNPSPLMLNKLIEASRSSANGGRSLMQLILVLASHESPVLRDKSIDSEHLFTYLCYQGHLEREHKLLRDVFTACSTYQDGLLTSVMSLAVTNMVIKADDTSVPITTLIEAALPLLQTSSPMSSEIISKNLPSMLEQVLSVPTPHSLMILHPIGSMVVCSRPSPGLSSNPSITFDHEGFSALLRFGIFLQAAPMNLGGLSTLFLHNLLIVESLLQIKDLDPEANLICSSGTVSTDNAVLQAFHERNQLYLKHYANLATKLTGNATTFIREFVQEDSALSPLAFFNAIALYNVLSLAREIGLSDDSAAAIFNACQDLDPDIGMFVTNASLEALSDCLVTSKSATLRRNRLASHLSGRLDRMQSQNNLRQLNALLPEGTTKDPIFPRPRLMFLIRHLLDTADDHVSDDVYTFELARLMLRLLPDVVTEYGAFWEGLVKWLVRVLGNAVSRPWSLEINSVLYVGLKLLAWLSTSYENNDDLSEYYLKSLQDIDSAVVTIFLLLADKDTSSQAITLSSLVAARLMRSVQRKDLVIAQRLELASVIATSQEHNQLTAFAALQDIVDEEREEMILSAALAKEYEEVSATLPPELISVVLDFPIEDEDKLYDTPLILPVEQRGYCIAWTLLFRYFKNTPLRMRVKLVEELQDLGLVDTILGFVFSVLKLKDDKPADIAKLTKVTLDTEYQDGKGELLSYAVHIYYLCLLHIPALVRAWWIECSDRTLSSAVELLTEKYFSMSLITNDIASIQGDNSKKVLSDDNLTIRVSNGGREIITIYEIDEQKMEMAIRLPANYPLRKVKVEGIQRIGVKDTQWRAWLLASQAVLTAQNGSILDAISLFQRNVSLHFEGVADCAICFSILSVQDKSLPSKKCATCKNLFHASCLFKWFKSSSQSRCPLCRNSFAF